MEKKGHGHKSRKREAAIAALLSESTIPEAAQKAGISYHTLKNWLAKEDFLHDYRQARSQVFERSLDRLLSVRLASIDTLKRNLSCGIPSVENCAAEILLEQGMREKEAVDILPRLAALEQRLFAPPAAMSANGAIPR
jgi:hypothetical protein